MSSTYAHYGAPSSLPSDYAILSASVGDRHGGHFIHDSPDIASDDSDDDVSPTRHRSRHPQYGSFESPRRGSIPQHPSTRRPSLRASDLPAVRAVSEVDPLLQPLPRIEEAGGYCEDANDWRTWWDETRILASYTVPVFSTHLLEYSLVVASVVSLGHLSTIDLAASTLASMTASVSALSLIQGMVSALDSLLPQAWTSGNPKLVGLWSQRMMVVMAVSIIPMAMIFFNAEHILLFLRQDPDVAQRAGLYLKWASLELPAYAFNAVSRRYFQSQGLLHVPSIVIMIVAPINVVLQYLLVWGPDPIRLGFIGAPIATALSMNLISIISIIYGVLYAPREAWCPITRKSFMGLGVLVRLGLAGVGQTASEWWSWELVGLAASLLGPVALASQSVLLVSSSTTYQAPFALSVAASVRIGNLIGAGRPIRAGVASKVALVLALAIAMICSTIFLTFRTSWALLFNDDEEVVALVATIIPLLSLFQVFDGICAVSGGALRARGKQFTGALLNLSAYYIFGIPLGLTLTFRYGMELKGLWIGLSAALAYGGCVSAWIVLRTNWDREVTRARERLKLGHRTDSEFDESEDDESVGDIMAGRRSGGRDV
ncbi:hypothetical protein BOTBODRAFT_164069 [Botryobasidium botryosum FD-172 SS1]|uniref:Multidrug/Oligosaccharidyl-lipid/Polysaccharide flippase n=1 Tax=Botryobasidium botryosum (strain FD-172 SS1) TaxID=930990 RepID=A0A067M6M6_BOTB1|nr:hypothetical protein BOTBODRAFT_164069 [Botryobasidium botryosum FD-172 SS1]